MYNLCTQLLICRSFPAKSFNENSDAKSYRNSFDKSMNFHHFELNIIKSNINNSSQILIIRSCIFRFYEKCRNIGICNLTARHLSHLFRQNMSKFTLEFSNFGLYEKQRMLPSVFSQLFCANLGSRACTVPTSGFLLFKKDEVETKPRT